MLAWTTSTMNAVRASESARATRAGGKARGTHRIATRRDARDADGVECVIRVELRAWTTLPRRRMTARGRNADRMKFRSFASSRTVAAVSSSRPSRARTLHDCIARAVVGRKPYEEGKPTPREGGRETTDDETRTDDARVFRVK